MPCFSFANRCSFVCFGNYALFLYLRLLITVQTNMSKRKAENDSRHESMNSGKMSCYLLRVLQENSCVLCVKTLFHIMEDMILADNETQIQTEIEGKLKLAL